MSSHKTAQRQRKAQKKESGAAEGESPPSPKKEAGGKSSAPAIPWYGAPIAFSAWTVIPTLFFAAFIMLLRKPDAFVCPQFYAEDGTILFTQQRAFGLMALLKPYPDYFWTLPRIVAQLSSPFSIESAPAAYNAWSLVCILLLSLFVLRRTAGFGVSAYLFALGPVLIPHGGEAWMHAESVHLLLSAAIPFLLLVPLLTNWKGASAIMAPIALLGLSGPTIVLSLPLFILRWLWLKKFNRYEASVCATAVLASAIQIICHLRNPDVVVAPPSTLGECLEAFLWRFTPYLFLGNRLPVYLPAASVVLSNCILVMSLCGILFLERRLRFYCFMFTALGGLLFAAALKRSQCGPLCLHPYLGGRYYFLPYLFLLWTYLVMAGSKHSGLRWIGRSAAALILLSSAAAFTMPPLQDLHWKEEVAKFREGTPLTVPINPVPWNITIR